MKKAGMNTMMEQLDVKRATAAYNKEYEAQKDREDLNRMNASALNPSATMTAGPKFC